MRKVVLLLVLLVIISGCSSQRVKVEQQTLMTGHTVAISKACFGATSKQAYDKLISYTSTQNVPAADQMKRQGLILVLNQGELGEIEETSVGSVKLKLLGGLYQGKTVYVQRELVTRDLPPVPQPKPQNKATEYSLNGLILTPEQKQVYTQWKSQFDLQIEKHSKIDKQVLSLVENFKNNNVESSAKAKGLEEELGSLLESLPAIPHILPVELASNLDTLKLEFSCGINDRRYILNKIIDHFDNDLPLDYALREVKLGVKSADEFFQKYKSKQQEINKALP